MAETFTNGFHIFQLDAREPQETISFSELSNELGEGYDDTILFGSNTGNRSFALDFPVIDMKTDSCVLDGTPLKPAEYLWDLFCRQKTTGKLFAIKSPRDGQYYLCKFADNNETQKGIIRKLFTGSAMFRQVRKSGVTVFDVAQISRVSLWHKTPITGAADNSLLPSGEWPNSVTGDDLISINCTYQTNEQNGLSIVRLDQSGSADTLATETPILFYEAFLVMKMREATFAADVGIISNNDDTVGSPALNGASGTTKFYNQAFGSGYTYKKNGIEYAESDQQAPMNVFGIVHIRRTGGWSMPQGLLFGRDRAALFPTRKANVDFGEIIICGGLLPGYVANEITEHLAVKWGI